MSRIDELKQLLTSAQYMVFDLQKQIETEENKPIMAPPMEDRIKLKVGARRIVDTTSIRPPSIRPTITPLPPSAFEVEKEEIKFVKQTMEGKTCFTCQKSIQYG